jgi:hypothetical protein
MCGGRYTQTLLERILLRWMVVIVAHRPFRAADVHEPDRECLSNFRPLWFQFQVTSRFFAPMFQVGEKVLRPAGEIMIF